MLTYCKHLDVLVSYAICWIPYSDHRAFREFELISLFFRHMCWGPSIIIHRPERVMRQFEYVQTIPPHPATPCLSVEEIDDRWIQFFEYLALVGQACVAPRQCATDYMEWFYMISHPFMTPAQPEDPPRHPPVVHDETFDEPTVAQQPMAATAMEEAHVEQPRHVVVKFQTTATISHFI